MLCVLQDSSGTMGLSSKGIERKPIRMLSSALFVKIASGAHHLVMLSEDGELYTCGCGEQGQLGRVTERSANRDRRHGMGECKMNFIVTVIGFNLHQNSLMSSVAANFLSPMRVTLNPRHKPEFEDVWAGTYCTFAKEKSKGHIYVFGLNNYNQLGEFQ